MKTKNIYKLLMSFILLVLSIILLIINKYTELCMINRDKIWILYLFMFLFFIFFLFVVIYNVIMKKENNKIYDILDIVNMVPLALVIVLIIDTFFLFGATVQGSSMDPTLSQNQELIITKYSKIEVGDIVIIEKNDGDLLVKRVVAVPGDVIDVTSNGIVKVNGLIVEDNPKNNSIVYESYTLKDGEYYCLGDNRSVSIDSRYYGIFTEIKGEVLFRISPFKWF